MLSFAKVSVRFFSCLSDCLVGHRCDHIQFDHVISAHPYCPPCMSLRRLTTTEGSQMRFFVSGDFSTVGIGHRFALQGGFKTFFDKTLLELLDFFGGHCIRRRNGCVCPTTGPIGLE